ncbi:MAG: shikimate kinase [Acutalibacteraceae bacterium]
MQYGLIGEHLGHSYSREIHEKIADYKYELLELKPDELGDFLTKKEFCGINVTIPYKQAVIPYLDEVSEMAESIGAVNTIVNKNGRLYGYNTDFAGMRELIRYANIDIKDKKIMILGTGGTSKTAHAVVQSLGAKDIIHVSRRIGENAVTYDDAIKLHTDIQVIVNTTPVGMYPNENNKPIDIEHFKQLEGIVDAVYNPLQTNLVLDGKARNISACGGLYMLAAQAVWASALFLDKDIEQSLIDKAFNLVMEQKENIVLIGMPTSGKTTVGKLLAEISQKKFYDTDRVITKKIGTISDYITQNGEPAFRAVEREVITEAARLSGRIIATGGGAVLDPENVLALKRNGILVFLDRSLNNLKAAPDRPLSSDINRLAKLYEVRYPIYKNAADICVDGDMQPLDVAKAVLKELKR